MNRSTSAKVMIPYNHIWQKQVLKHKNVPVLEDIRFLCDLIINCGLISLLVIVRDIWKVSSMGSLSIVTVVFFTVICVMHKT